MFLLVGYGTKVGLAPFHAWLPDAHAEGPTPISAVLSGLLLNVALYALLRFKMLLAANPETLNVGAIMIVLGLISLVFAAFMLYRRRDIKRLFAYSSIEHMGIITFAFGMGGPLANFAGLLHMTMHSLTKSAIFFAVGHIAQVKGTQRIADIGGLSVTHPVLAVGLALGVIAIAGLPPFGMFLSEFMLVSSTFARQPLLAVVLVFGLLIAFGALVLRLQDVLFGEPSGPVGHVKASYVPLFVHLALRAGRRPVAAGADRALVPRRRGAARVTRCAHRSPRCCRAARRLPATGRGRATRSMPTPGPPIGAGARRRRRRSAGAVGGRHACTSRAARADTLARRASSRSPCQYGGFPSIGRHHAPAIRLERTIRDLYGFEPIGSADHAPVARSRRLGRRARRSARRPPANCAIRPTTSSCRSKARGCIRFRSARCMPASSSRAISASPPTARRSRGWRSGSAMSTRASTA